MIQTSIDALASAAHAPATAAGAARYSTEIVADQMQMLGGGVVEGRHELDHAVAFVNELPIPRLYSVERMVPVCRAVSTPGLQHS
ncbi:hypothetical protein WT05_21590 [Burkholderia stagnalis]|nr:hypothetical protein WT05_21590 [Burkholderia stagnalis]